MTETSIQKKEEPTKEETETSKKTMILDFILIGLFMYIPFSLLMAGVNYVTDLSLQKEVIQKFTDYNSVKSGAYGDKNFVVIEELDNKKLAYVKSHEEDTKEEAYFVYEINKDMSYSLKENSFRAFCKYNPLYYFR